ncbi:MAG: MFS transporter [Neisseriales bacterium]|nr:MAG: MFS transporter [Neisseriales bacterium]
MKNIKKIPQLDRKKWQRKVRNKKRLPIFLQFFSSVVEYYDFFSFSFIFFYLIGTVSHQTIELYGIALISLVTFLFRPVGYRVQIWLTQHYSRKIVIIINGTMMTVSILIPGLITTVDDSPWLICGIIFLSRVINGISFGIKLQSNVTYIKYSFPKRLRYTIATSTLGAQLGLSLSVFINHAVTQYLSIQQLEWGWRIPFFFGALLSLILFATRFLTYSRLNGLTDLTMKIPLDKFAFKAGKKLWLGLIIISTKACITYTIFISIPFLIGSNLDLNLNQVTQVMFITSSLNTLTSWVSKYNKRSPKLSSINYALILSLILMTVLIYAMINKLQILSFSSIYLLGILNGYLFVVIPRLIECTLPEEVKFESMLFISNYEYFHFNVIRRLALLITLVVMGSSFTRYHLMIVLMGSLWAAIIPGIFALSYLYYKNRQKIRQMNSFS